MFLTATKTRLLILSVLLCASAWAQTALTTTTLAQAVNGSLPNASTVGSVQSYVVLPSLVNINPITGNPNAIRSVLYVDREMMAVETVNAATFTVNVMRGYNSTFSTPHNSGATVYVGSPDQFYSFDPAGACTAGNTKVTPWINYLTGNQWTCGSGGSWILGSVFGGAGIVQPASPGDTYVADPNGTNAIDATFPPVNPNSPTFSNGACFGSCPPVLGTNAAFSVVQGANGNDTLVLSRFTDSSPSGSLFRILKADKVTEIFRFGVGAGQAVWGTSSATGLSSGVNQCTLSPDATQQLDLSCNASNAYSLVSMTATLTADSTQSASATPVNSGLVFPIVANGIYYLECDVWFNMTTTLGGINLYVNGPGTPTRIATDALFPTNITTGAALLDVPTTGTAYQATMASGTITGTGNGHVRLAASIQTGSSAGSLVPQFSNNGTTGLTKLLNGTTCNLKQN